MKPINFKQVNVKWAENQDEYQTLPAFTDDTETISCWKFSWRELVRLLFTRRIWLRQMNRCASLQPILPQVEEPFPR